MTQHADGTEKARLLAAISGLEAQRRLLGDAIVDPAVAALRQQLAALQSATEEIPLKIEERRIITILFSDIVGSTSLAERLDPEDWRNQVAQVHQRAGDLIKQYHGAVMQYMGDGLLAVFGAYGASETDPANAVHAALAIQTSLTNQPVDESIHLRIGIHTGLVIVGEIGSESKREFTAIGDAMNVAARLQSAAPVGGVLISHDTYRHVRGLFETISQPLLQVKGKAEPVQTYVVQRADQRSFVSTPRGVAGVQVSTIGRESELAQLHDALDQVLDAGKTVWLQLIGEPGMGKSNLLNRMRRELELSSRPILVLKARAFQGDDNVPYGLIRNMWFDHFQIAQEDSLAQAENRWLERFLKLCACNDEEAAHVLGLLVGLQFTSSPHIKAMRADPLQVRGRGIVVSRELLHNLRMQAPVAILMEDLHWADPSSFEYLNEVLLKEDAAQHGLFVLATARPEWKPADHLTNHQRTMTLAISALPPDSFRQLARELLRQVSDVHAQAIDFIVQHAEGVPYYAEEIVNWFLDQNIIRKTGHEWRFDMDRLQESPLPATLQLLLSTRIEALNASERHVLQCSAVIGRNFWEDALAAMDVPDCHQPLDDLHLRRFIDAVLTSTFSDSREWSFHHNLMQEVAYESVLKRERRRLHKLVAGWLEKRARAAGRLDEFAGTIGDFITLAGDPLEAVDWLMRAGKVAFSRGATRVARSYYERVLKSLPETDRVRRWNALLGLSDVVVILGDQPVYQSVVESMLGLAAEIGDHELAEACYRQGYFWDYTGDYRQALVAYQAGIQAAARAHDIVLLTTLLALAVICHNRLGDLAAASLGADQVLANADQAGHTLVARALTNLATYYVESGDYGQAVELYQEQVSASHQVGDRGTEASAQINLGYSYLCLGLYDHGRRALERAVRLCQEFDSYRNLVYSRLNLALATYRFNELPAALHLLDQLDADIAASGDAFVQASAQSYWAMTLEALADYPAAIDHYQKGQQILNRLGVQGYALDCLAGVARCELQLRHMQPAIDATRVVWEYLQQKGAAGMEFPVRAYLTCASVWDAAGDTNQSRLALEKGYAELAQRADKISQPQWRISFMTAVPEHRLMAQLFSSQA